MINATLLKDLAAKLAGALPHSVQTCKADFEKTCHHLLMQTFEKLDLVTREEFDTQAKVLQRTRHKLDALSTQLRELEAILKHDNEDK